MEMMSQMMRGSDSTSCNDIMHRMSAIYSNDTLSMNEMASQMLPVCVRGIVMEIPENQRAEFLLDLSKEIIYSGYDSLPEMDKRKFKSDLLSFFEEL